MSEKTDMEKKKLELKDEALASVAGGINSNPTKEDVEMAVRLVVSRFIGIPASFLPTGLSFTDMGLDSLDVVDFACCIEEEFGIKIDDGELESLKTPDDIIAAVISKLGLN